MRVIETKSLNSTSTTMTLSKTDHHHNNLQPHHIHQHQHHRRRTSSPNDYDGSQSAHSASQVSTPSMKAMTPLAMDELNNHHNSSSTESAQDQTELDAHQLQNRTDTPRKRPSKIPLAGSKGYLAPKPPTGRSPTTPTPTGQRNSPSGPASNRSLSKSTGSLIGASSHSSRSTTGPNSVSRRDMAASLNRPESAQSLRKDSSISSSRSSSIPVATIHTTPTSSKVSPAVRHNNSPLPKPKRDTFSSRVRQMDSLTRAHGVNNFPATSPVLTMSPSPTTYITTTSNISKSSSAKKDAMISSSFSQGQTRDRKATAVSVRRVSSASVGRGGLAGAVELSTNGAHNSSNGSNGSSDADKDGKVPNLRTRFWNLISTRRSD